MPVSPRTFWYIGAATAATAATAGGVLISRGLKKRQQISTLSGGLEGGVGIPEPELPPIPPTPTPDPRDQLEFQVPGPDLRVEICRQWMPGGTKPNWRPELYAVVNDEIHRQIDMLDTEWETIGELRTKSFLVARGTLAALCPKVELPDAVWDVQTLKDKRSYWRELWDLIHSNTYDRLSGVDPTSA